MLEKVSLTSLVDFIEFIVICFSFTYNECYSFWNVLELHASLSKLSEEVVSHCFYKFNLLLSLSHICRISSILGVLMFIFIVFYVIDSIYRHYLLYIK